ncbi:hypothetical protein T492DRAFT_957935 [Pavlovales sp. CCMP2436]|nr:hypothetical protein T492DRAFT_957935 [Pavlovales sp. CCMP2436]
MGNTCCGMREMTSTKNVTLGGGALWNQDVVIPFGIKESIKEIPIGTVCCFDNKSKKKTLIKQMASADIGYTAKRMADDFMPRIGVVMDSTGYVSPIHLGSSSALRAQDLECISLISKEENTYVATSSLGVTHVFQLNYSTAGCFNYGILTADHISQGQLPVPPEESTVLGSLNQCNIEATAVFKDSLGVTRMFWCGRGGLRTGRSWTMQAPFMPVTGRVEETMIDHGYFANVTSQPKWRVCTAIVIEVEAHQTHFYFSSTYDGMDDGRELDLTGDQTNLNNKRVFKSVIAKTSYPLGITSILATLHGVKIEALMKVENAMGKVTHLVLGSDDEDLGSLLGVMDVHKPMNTTFVNLGLASETKTFITRDKWGTSGMAPAGVFAFDLVKQGSF